MAFPIPEHLPRAVPQDISTRILTKVASASSKTLNAELALSWISELDETILQTKTRIHERIHSDLPAFEEQLATSNTVQERLRTLTSNVDLLSESVSNPTTGLVPPFLAALSAHATLTQQVQDASIFYGAVSHLLQCRQQFQVLESLAREGKLSEAAEASRRLEGDIENAPRALALSDPLLQLRNQFRAVKDRVEEQLGDAYSRAVSITPDRMVIRPLVPVRQSSTTIMLPAIFASFSADSLSNHLSTLRRDISSYYIERSLMQSATLTPSVAKDQRNASEATLGLTPKQASDGDLRKRLDNLEEVLKFLDVYLFPALPLASTAAFKRTLCKPVTEALLHTFFIPHLPSTFVPLPSYLDISHRAVQIEERYIIGTLGQDARDHSIHDWVDRISVHYERKRSAYLLNFARTIILHENDGGKVPIEIEVETPKSSPGMPEVEQMPPTPALEPEPELTPVPVPEEDNWGLNDDGDGWGLDDEESAAASLPPTSSASASQPTPNNPHTNGGPNGGTNETEDDPGDAWGWNDDDDLPTDISAPTSASISTTDESSTWDDDPWGDDPWGDGDSSTSVPEPVPTPASSSPARLPKPATRLEKLANKGKAKHAPQPSTESIITHPPPPTPASPIPPQHVPARKITVPIKTNVTVPSSPAPTQHVKDVYYITGRVRDLATAAEDAFHEGIDFARATLFDSVDEQRGVMIVQAAVGTLDLFRALYPVRFAEALAQSPEMSMLLVNDLTYLLSWTKRQSESGAAMAERLKEAAKAFEILSESCFDQAIDTQEQTIVDILAEVDGLTETSDQERFDECEMAVTRVLGQIRDVGRRWKNILTKTRYFTAVGALVDSALSRTLDDILALPDITEVESHRLSELCRIFTALEGLFVDDPEAPSLVVAYVPSWLKFSYLSELLEASLADVTYLFEEGALVDFEVAELIRLVKALFAETPQRASLIQKLSVGHPDAG